MLCGIQEFYDTVTRKCAPCSDLCMHKEQQGTVEECDDKCPSFLIQPMVSDSSYNGDDTDNTKYTVLLYVVTAICIVIAFILLLALHKHVCLLGRRICRLLNSVCGIHKEKYAQQPEDNSGGCQIITSANQSPTNYIQQQEISEHELTPLTVGSAPTVDETANDDDENMSGQRINEDVAIDID